MNRAVIAGYGVTSPIGNEPETFLESLKTGKNGIGPTSKFDVSETGVILAAEVKDFPMEKYSVKEDGKCIDKLSLFGIYAVSEAMAMSGLDTSQLDVDRFGAMVGSGIGGLEIIQNQVIRMHDEGPERVASLFIPMAIGNMVAGDTALRVDTKGICISTVTACASATCSTGEAFRNTKHGYSGVIIAGGAEASIIEIGISGLASLTALTKATDPEEASIPSDRERSGSVMGEGAGVFILESLDHILERGATILGEAVSYGASCDAHHMTSPTPDGSGATKAMVLAMEEAGISPEKIGYINAHGTSTQANDSTESEAIELALGDATETAYASSTKDVTEHLLGAAGGIEGIVTLNALQHQFIPPTINVENQDEAIAVNVVLNESREHEFNYALSNSLGFGGRNAVICLKRWED